jgi:demethylmenaquinone methyltransferase/2-methoxy-6-polyprenyl-1,4-benzoquinol methylase
LLGELSMEPQDSKTHFGYQVVDTAEKQQKVKHVFDKVASKYDLMNDLMSLGVHHFWKWFTIYCSAIRPNQKILDLAGGSGDLSQLILKKYYPQIEVVLADINANMLAQGRHRLLNSGFCQNVGFVLANAECLPFHDRCFDMIFMAFGLRNVTHQQNALNELYRITKPGGKICILEFSKPNHAWIKSFYDWYSFHVIPKLGKWFANDSASYEYLVESIRMHPDQETLKQMILKAGFDTCRVVNLTGGIVALHIAHRY